MGHDPEAGAHPGAAGAAAARAEASAAPPAWAIVALTDLSPQQRAEWPNLAIGGAIYTNGAAGRFLLINGQVVREGEAAAPGVTLERILPRKAILRWREMRGELPI